MPALCGLEPLEVMLYEDPKCENPPLSVCLVAMPLLHAAGLALRLVNLTLFY